MDKLNLILDKIREYFNKLIDFLKKLIANPVFIAIGTGLIAVAAMFLKKLMSNEQPPTNNTQTTVTEDDVDEDSYVHPDISEEEEATENQTQTINTIIKDGAQKVEDAKEDTNIETIQNRIDKGWDEL